MQGYSTLSSSFNTVFLFSIGEFDFAELREAASPLTASVFFWSASSVVAFVLLRRTREHRPDHHRKALYL